VTYERLREAAGAIAEKTGRSEHSLAIVLGSGLSSYAATLPGAIAIPYADIPGFPVPGVAGHSGMLYSADLDGAPVLVLAGRAHLYEGRDLGEIVLAVRSCILAGCRRVVLTNASGGVGDGLEPGDLVLLTDHINLTGQNPLVGANDERLGPRFPDMSAVYAESLRSRAGAIGEEVAVPLKEGVYAWFPGPSYETPAEVQMAKRMGATLVGMSTVPEAIAARHMGAEVLGISLVTNLAAGISDQPLSHEEVTETAAAARDRFTRLLDRLLPDLAAR
jgi:purine-nucleoside phosphorylase